MATDASVSTSAIILAAGRGSRLLPLTESRPKCLVEVEGHSILARALSACHDVGISDVVVCAGFAAETVERCLPDIASIPARVCINEDFAVTGTVVSLALSLREVSANNIVIIEGDVVFSTPLLRRLVEHPFENATLVDHFEGYSGSLVELTEAATVRRWLHERVREPGFDESGAFKTVNLTKLGPGAARRLDAWTDATIQANGRQAPLEFLLDRGVREGLRVDAVLTEREPWYEVDTPQDLAAANDRFRSA